MSDAPTTRSIILRYYLPVILWAAVIAGLSTRGFDTGFTFKLLKSANELFGAVFSVAELRAINAVVRKLGHVGEYFILGLMLWRALRRGRDEAWRWGWALGTMALGAAWAGLDELHQRFERGRGSSLVDVGWDSLGLLLALAVLFVLSWWKRGAAAQEEERNFSRAK
ncbi:MAG: VanZ family protein [Acidobacteria bacterium]|nr:VanZ family protein [Acidobacteriota bacterium]